MTMQVQIRHKGGNDVTLEDCANFSEPMAKAIETSQILDQAYVLEISSPGIKAELSTEKDFRTFRGFPVEVTFQSKEAKSIKSKGLLHEKSAKDLSLNIKGRIQRIPIETVIDVKLTSLTG